VVFFPTAQLSSLAMLIAKTGKREVEKERKKSKQR
jgi:hypothetical protein